MPSAPQPTSETIARMANELIGVPMREQELGDVAALLGGLALEMASMRAMDVACAEPATTYDASEP